jgi:hypothetical protein
MTVACITALCAEVDAPLGALPPPPERPTSGPARSSPWGSCRPAQAWAPGPALAGCRATRARCVPPSPSAPGSCAAAGRLRTGRRASWPPRRGSASSPRRGSRCATPGAPAAVPTRWAGKASRTTAGWAGGNCVSSCISGGWSWGGAWATAPGAAHTLPGLRQQGDGRRLVLRDTGCQAAAGAPRNLPRCPRGAWQARRLVETVFALLPLVAGSGGESPLASSPQHWTCTFPGIPRTPLKGRVTDPSAVLYPAGGTRRQRRRGPGGAGRTRGTRPPPWASPALPMLP